MKKEKSFEELYPESVKMNKITDKSQSIGEFLDWLNSNKRFLAEYGRFDRPVPIRESIHQILAEYFEIDLDKVEEEKRHMIAHFNDHKK